MKTKTIVLFIALIISGSSSAYAGGLIESIFGGSSSSGPGGTFTLTGIPAQYNGKYAALVSGGGGDLIMGYESSSPTRYPQISNGRVSIPMWIYTDGKLLRYSGNDTVSGISVYIYETSGPDNRRGEVNFASQITYSNGSAMATFSAKARRL